MMTQTYIIGEIGQNHNGSVDVAKLIVDLAVRPVVEKYFNIQMKGIDAIKLTKRDLNQELATSQWNQIYDSPNSFGRTYGEHRSFLELSDMQHFELYQYVKQYNIDFIETICAIGGLSLLRLFTPDRLKVASRDITNHPLLSAMAETKIPIILSTGMSGVRELDDALNIISKHHNNISILHCVSQYPTHPDNLNLKTISYLKKYYSQYTIGLSDHTIGISAPIAAIGMGAQIIEKHITIDRHMKGSDQACSLGPEGINRMIRDIRLAERWLGEESLFIDTCVAESKLKLERSIATNRKLNRGDIILEKDLHLLSPGDGFKWAQKDLIIGKTAVNDILANEIIYPKDIE